MHDLTITKKFLAERARRAIAGGYPVPKWVQFCEAMLAKGYTVTLYEARKTVSKYLFVYNAGQRFKVRFSNHKPGRQRQQNRDCDFFVGVSNGLVTTTADAIRETIAALGDCPFAGRGA